MAEYDIQFVTSAAKEFRSLSTTIKERIAIAVDALTQSPRPTGVKKLKGHEQLTALKWVYTELYMRLMTQKVNPCH